MDSGLWSAIKSVKEGRDEGLEDFVSRTLPGLQVHFQDDLPALESFYEKLGSSLDNLKRKDDFWVWCQQLEPSFSFSSELPLEQTDPELAKRGLKTGLSKKGLAPSIRRQPVRLMLSFWLPFALYFFAALQSNGIVWDLVRLTTHLFVAGCYATVLTLLFSPFLSAFRRQMRTRSVGFTAICLGFAVTFVVPALACGLRYLLLHVSWFVSNPDLSDFVQNRTMELNYLSAYSLWDSSELGMLFWIFVMATLSLWPLCALTKNQPGVVNRAGTTWRKVLSLPFLLLLFYGLSQDVATIYKGWEIDPHLVEFAQKESPPESPPQDPRVDELFKGFDDSTSLAEKRRAWLEVFPDLWERDEWWNTKEYQALAKRADSLTWGPRQTAVELEFFLRLSFARKDVFWLDSFEKLELKTDEWESLVDLGRLSVRVTSQECEPNRLAKEFLMSWVGSLQQAELYHDDWYSIAVRAHLNRVWSLMSEGDATAEDLEAVFESGMLYGDWVSFRHGASRYLTASQARLLALELKRMLSQGEAPASIADLPKESRDLLGQADGFSLSKLEGQLQIRQAPTDWVIFRVDLPKDPSESDQMAPTKE